MFRTEARRCGRAAEAAAAGCTGAAGGIGAAGTTAREDERDQRDQARSRQWPRRRRTRAVARQVRSRGRRHGRRGVRAGRGDRAAHASAPFAPHLVQHGHHRLGRCRRARSGCLARHCITSALSAGGRSGRALLQGRRRLGEVRGDHRLRAAAREGTAAGQALVGHDAEGVDVGAVRRSPGRRPPARAPCRRACRARCRAVVRPPPRSSAEVDVAALIALATPKSVTIAPPAESSTLSGLMSRWTMPRSCA